MGHIFSGAPALLCTLNSLASGGLALGAQESEAELHDVATAAGLTQFRRATETPFNCVLTVRRRLLRFLTAAAVPVRGAWLGDPDRNLLGVAQVS